MITRQRRAPGRGRRLFTAAFVALALAATGVWLYRQTLAAPLRAAVLRLDPDAVARLLRRGAPVNATDEGGHTCLSLALSWGNGSGSGLSARRDRIVALLLRAGADPNKTSFGAPLLYYALNSRALASVRALVAHGADPNAVYNGMPLLMEAVFQDAELRGQGEQTAPLFTQALLAGGAGAGVRRAYDRAMDVVGPDPSRVGDVFLDELPLIVAVRYDGAAFFPGYFGGDATLIETLLGHGADVNGRNHWGQTALFVAAALGNTADVRTLLARGADPRLADRQGRTPREVARAGEQRRLAEARAARKNLAMWAARRRGHMTADDRRYTAQILRWSDAAAIKARYDAVEQILHHAPASARR